MADPDQDQLSKLAKRMLSIPPMKRNESKIGKAKAKAKPTEKPVSNPKTRPASKGRVHKGRTRS